VGNQKILQIVINLSSKELNTLKIMFKKAKLKDTETADTTVGFYGLGLGLWF